MSHFQKNFLWGSATAAYQIEGASDIDGKGLSIWDVYSKQKGNTYLDTNGDVAIDFYHHYKEDIKLMAEMGLKAYRFSISWPRILPKGKGEINQAGIDFYHNVIDELLKYNIEPVVTTYHWDLPQALQDEYQGWESREVIDDFTNYNTILFKEYGDKVKHWITLNEQNIFIGLGYLECLHPPKKNDYQAFLTANHHAFLAHAKTVVEFRKICPDGKIGASFAYGPVYAQTNDPNDALAMEDSQEMGNFFWMDVYARGEYPRIALRKIEQLGYQIPFADGDVELLKSAKADFMGINYYQTISIKSPKGLKKGEELEAMQAVERQKIDNPAEAFYVGVSNDKLPKTDWNWAIDPIGLRIAIRRISSRYDLPVMISENGLGAVDELTEEGKIHDEYRIAYLEEHIKEVDAAINDGCEVIGYFTWSFQDLFSWLNGYKKRYGFVFVDRTEEDEKELKRYKKDSFYWYQKVIENNGLDKA